MFYINHNNNYQVLNNWLINSIQIEKKYKQTYKSLQLSNNLKSSYQRVKNFIQKYWYTQQRQSYSLIDIRGSKVLRRKMNGNARDFFFHNRPLETNLDYLKKNDTNSEVNWEGDSEFRSNSGINMHFSNTKLSSFKMDTIKDDEINPSKQKNSQSKGTLSKIHTDIENTLQKPSLSNQVVVEEEQQDETEKDQNFAQNNSIQSPINDKAFLNQTSKNQALIFKQQDKVQQNDNNTNFQEKNKIQNKEQNANSINSILPQVNSKLVSHQQVDLKGDDSPAGSQNTNQMKSPSNIEQTPQSQMERNKQKPQNLKLDKENQQQQAQNKNEKEDRVKLFKFRTQIESVHEVENWKDYNRENSQDNKKIGCSCTIY